MFGLKVIRRRLFESNLIIPQPKKVKRNGTVPGGQYVTPVGHDCDGCCRVAAWREEMQIDWMTRQELTQAIPPAYTRYIGKHIKWQL